VTDFQHVLTIEVAPERGQVYEEGWQSWSPSTIYPVSGEPLRAPTQIAYRGGYGGTRPAPEPGQFQGEGLLAIDPGNGSEIVVVGAESAQDAVPTIRAILQGGELIVSANGPILLSRHPAADGIPAALGAFGDGFAERAGVAALRPAPTIWCSWYHYFTRVTEADMDENLAAIRQLELPVDVVQLDDGYQTMLGDWLTLSDRFVSLPGLVERIKAAGKRAGIWIAPFLVGARSQIFAEHPDWLVGGAAEPVLANHNWDQDCFALDATHPGVQAYLTEVFSFFADIGFDFYKIDFIYAGALDGARHAGVTGVQAYRSGLDLIRNAIGPEAYLLGCGAPILPSVGKVDAMRISPDTAPHWKAWDDDQSKPGGESAILTGTGRAWQQGRFWVNDPDCLIVRPEVEKREEVAANVEQHGGLRGSSDRIAALDDWGLAETRRLLGTVPPPSSRFWP
jgi:alpha-galactosidase